MMDQSLCPYKNQSPGVIESICSADVLKPASLGCSQLLFSGYNKASLFRDVVHVGSFGKPILGENESSYRAVYFTSVDSWLSNMPDLLVSVSWLVLMLTNIAQKDLDEPRIKRSCLETQIFLAIKPYHLIFLL